MMFSASQTRLPKPHTYISVYFYVQQRIYVFFFFLSVHLSVHMYIHILIHIDMYIFIFLIYVNMHMRGLL